MEQSDADQIVAALRGFDPNFLLIGNIPVGEFISCIRRLQDSVQRLQCTIAEHNAECQGACEARRSSGLMCVAYTSRGRNCPDCPLGNVLAD